MKFAIHKLAMACVVPTTMLVGMSTRLDAQDAGVTATSRVTAVTSAGTTTFVTPPNSPPKLLPEMNFAAPIRLGQSDATRRENATRNRSTVTRKPVPNNAIRQVANQVPQKQQPQLQPQQMQQEPAGGETDVQRQLRLLYEKSGQEMPVMDINEMVVPEPQPGVMPGAGAPGNGGAPGGMPPSVSQPGMQPPADAPKKPSFFERYFLGKKGPPPAPQMQQPGLQRPGATAAPGGAVRPQAGMPATPKPGPQNTPAYRPYTPNPPAQSNAAVQRPGMTPSVGASNQRPNPQTQQRPQGYPAEQATPVVQPVQQPSPQPGQGQLPPQNAGNQTQQPQAVRKSELPVLEDEPEESLEIDLTPRAPVAPANRAPQSAAQQPAARQTPVPQVTLPRGVIPAPVPTPAQANSGSSESNSPSSSSTPQEENPFSGLRLTIPDAAPQRPATTFSPPSASLANTPVINPLSPSNANTTLTNRPLRTTPAAAPLAPQPNGMTSGGPARPTLSKSGAQTVPAIPVGKQSVSGPETNPFLEPAIDRTTPLSMLDDNLRKLAEATEKQGFKGFCPVMLRQHRTLANAKPQFNSLYQGKKFRFSSADAKAQFEKSPHLFAPAHNGLDGVAFLDTDKSLEASLDFACWYRGRLYMFTNRENLELFNAEPDQYVDEAELDATLEKALANPVKPKANAGSAAPAANALQPKPSANLVPKSTGTLPSGKPAAGQPTVGPMGVPQAGTQSGTTTPRTSAVKAKLPDDLPVLPDDIEAIEPIAPPTNGNQPASPTVLQPNSRGSQSSSSPSATNSAPKQIAPKPVTTPSPKADGVKTPETQIEGPKLQGPKLNALAAPIKPASGTSNQQSYPAPRLIPPALKLAAPAVNPTQQ